MWKRSEVNVCQTCGDEGYTNAFVYCVKCLDFVIHRYCLNVMPTTFNERVLWYCEHCKPTVGNQVTSPEVRSSRSQKEEAASSGQVKSTNHKKKQKERDIASIIAGTVVVNCQESTTEPEAECILPTDSLKEASMKLNSRHKRITSSKPGKRKKIAARLDAKKKEHKLRSGLKTETQKACTKMADSVKHSKNRIHHTASNLKNNKGVVDSLDEQTHESRPSQPPRGHKKLSSDSPSMKEESDKTTNHECQAEKANKLQTKQDIVFNLSQSADFENNVPCGQPIIDPVWRGSFSILDRDYDLFEGFVAHLSTKACDKVYKEANMLPSLLQLEMHPKTVLWPKSFQECEPSDVNIALYFFPGDQINEKDFDHLVIDMMDKGLAMRAMATNAELLIFTSRVLPQLFSRFQGKYYLWGVFKAKKNGSSSVASHNLSVVNNSDKHDLTKGSPNEVFDVKAVLTKVKTLDSHSPRSPFSNNGENGVDMDPESGD
ncbi:Zinc finger, FYVE/PHD-type [Cynara cardunculus var. scolymus]|uniref:Zinc finger, FYVE/PHD-type n=1 Tax=Cynara cardunculus var. scolymus TaxID=59895 RepID=A0A124SFF5_CYNCS|nr:Zinc finger, FYVE/PHD-type [Cynara cardunculus var. scolymus]